ncbi:MAG: hypothetical protein PHV34_12935 [Verrucomicrobiae bacterium]|nr:hypothetical protein [Verrucomicrobiae bacterium]
MKLSPITPKSTGSILILFLTLIMGHPLFSQDMEMRDFLFTGDFESGKDPFEYWTEQPGMKYKVNFKGITDEKACSGKKSFKLDVSFENNGYIYWAIPVHVPAEGKLTLSFKALLGEKDTVGAGFGIEAAFPPTTRCNNSPPLASFSGADAKDKWIEVKADLVKTGRQYANTSLKRREWSISADDVGIYVEKFAIFLSVRYGKRTVIYIDDVKIEGRVPAENAYKKDIEKRWTTYQARLNRQIDEWTQKLADWDDHLQKIDTAAEKWNAIKTGLAAKLEDTRKDVEKIKKQQSLSAVQFDEIKHHLLTLEKGLDLLKQAAKKGDDGFKNICVFILKPTSALQTLPTDPVVPGALGGEINLAAAPGEFEPGSFAVRAASDLAGLKITASPLTCGKASIPAGNIGIKVVKCWHQSGTAGISTGQDKSRRILIPELLLNDDSLVKVDLDKKENHLKLSYPDGEKYSWISDPNGNVPKTGPGGAGILFIKDFPVKDSPTLLPVAIKAGTNKQFWLTVKVPDSAPPGTYHGNLTLSDGNEPLGTLKLTVKVLPFKLLPPYYTSSIYYMSHLNAEFPEGTISSAYKSEKQLRAEFEDLRDHGVTNPMVYQPSNNPELLARYFKIRNETGLNDPTAYTIWGSTTKDLNLSPQALENLKESVKRRMALLAPFGIKELYLYGIDEAQGSLLKSQRLSWQAVHEAGGKVFVAGQKEKNFESMGDMQDLLVCANELSREEAARWHSRKHQIWSYANPQGGVESPEIYRKNYGFSLWKNNYDGACTFAYQHGYRSPWNDFDAPDYRDEVMVYPTLDGVIDTIQWEGYREAVDDVRYLTTLLDAIKKARATDDQKKRNLARDAQKYLDQFNPEEGDLDEIRAKIAEYIMQLN